MKINWGTGLVIGMALFVSFILYFVIRISTEEKFNHDLVTEQYYEKELVFQQEIDAEKNFSTLKGKVKTHKSEEGIKLFFPEEMDARKIAGTVFMYRPSNKKLDYELRLDVKNQEFLIPADQLLSGRWDLKVAWEYDGTPYLLKEKFNY